jgi:hypothetical protein
MAASMGRPARADLRVFELTFGDRGVVKGGGTDVEEGIGGDGNLALAELKDVVEAGVAGAEGDDFHPGEDVAGILEDVLIEGVGAFGLGKFIEDGKRWQAVQGKFGIQGDERGGRIGGGVGRGVIGKCGGEALAEVGEAEELIEVFELGRVERVGCGEGGGGGA